MLAAALAVTALLAAVVIRLMPHSIMQAIGIACTTRSGCVAPLPMWAQWGLWSFSAILLVGLLARGAYAAVSATRAMSRMKRAALFAGRTATPDSWLMGMLSERVVLLDGPDIIAFTVGLTRPLIVLSTSLVRTLSAREIETIVAHETAHISGHDNLILLVARTLEHALWFLPGVGLVHHHLRRVIELAADSHASREVGDGLLVASSLHRFASLMSTRSTGVPKGADLISAQFSEDGLVAERIVRLLQEPDRVTSRFRVRLAFLAIAAVLLAFTSGSYLLADVNPDPGSHAIACAGPAHGSQPHTFF